MPQGDEPVPREFHDRLINCRATSIEHVQLSSQSLKQNNEKRTVCVDCRHDFKTVSNHNKHRRDKHEKMRYACTAEGCDKKYSRKDYADKHKKQVHGSVSP